MTDLMKFDFEGQGVRSVDLDNKRWLVASDFATLLGYVNPRDAIGKHCKHAKVVNMNTVANRDGIRGNPNVTLINQADAMRLVCSSQLASAERVESWLFDEVFVAISETGSYVAPGAAPPALPMTPATQGLLDALNAFRAEAVGQAAAETAEAEKIAADNHARLMAQNKANIGLLKATALSLVSKLNAIEKDPDGGLQATFPPDWAGSNTLKASTTYCDTMLGLGFKTSREANGFMCDVIRWVEMAREEAGRDAGSGQMEFHYVPKPSPELFSLKFMERVGDRPMFTALGRGALEAKLAYHRQKYDLRGLTEISRLRGIVCGKSHAGDLPEIRAAFEENRSPVGTAFTGLVLRQIGHVAVA